MIITEFCRNCGRPSGLLKFAVAGLCVECHALPSIATRYSIRTGELLLPAPKHDGFLDEKHEYEVSYWQPQSKTPRIYIEETSDIKDEPEFVSISPSQALSLLAWLLQEETELRRMAEETAK